MNYELAKELKDAGFPQNIRKGELNIKEFMREEHAELLYFPSLSELIEAVPDEIKPVEMKLGLMADFTLTGCRRRKDWLAGYSTTLKWEEICGEGSTPEEAVARLWLALNKPTV